MTNLGLYIHIPFCQKKCAYCDFYSAVANDGLIDDYVTALKKDITQWGGKLNRPIDTIYLGGGTPSLLDWRLPSLLQSVYDNFNVSGNAEITLEINPQSNIKSVLENAKKAGVNRLSIGAQSGNDRELLTLGRTHTKADTENAVKLAREMDFSNISLDLIIGQPDSTINSLQNNLDFLLGLSPEHLSAYILKIEPKTLFYKQKESLNLPGDDAVCDQYLFMCDYLKNRGFSHYEISNFALDGKESRHNLKYWECKEYLGLGPSAHSFLDGKRFYYKKDLREYIKGTSPVFDSDGGSISEKIMLGLRLKKGVPLDILPPGKTDLFVKNGFATVKNNRFSLTDKGFLVSNSIITQLLEN